MAANNNELKLAPLRSEIRDAVRTFAEKVIERKAGRKSKKYHHRRQQSDRGLCARKK